MVQPFTPPTGHALRSDETHRLGRRAQTKLVGMTSTERLRRLRLFLVSYAPLWLMLALRALPDDLTWRWTGHPAYACLLFTALAVWSFTDGWRLVRGAQRRNGVTKRFFDVRDEGAAAG